MRKQFVTLIAISLFLQAAKAQETEADPIMRTEVVSEAPKTVTEPPARLEVQTQKPEKASHAQLETKMVATAVEKKSVAQGLRLSLSKPVLDMTSARLEYNYYTGMTEYQKYDGGRTDSALALSVGYADFPQNQAGWSVNVAYVQQEPSFLSMWRVDGNLGIAFANYFILKGGLNLSGFNDSTMSGLNPGIGYQGGLGVQITPNFGLDVGFVQMLQTRRGDAGRVAGSFDSVKQAGTEIAIHATF